MFGVSRKLPQIFAQKGGFTQEQAQDLVIMLRSGALPARLTVVDERIGGRSGG